ncbi:hypothetical protein KKB99_07510 [bacterium]|nr:hypothetical protein [bacterium]MBU1025839.1 hypothetical protein [bacterium]
MMNSRTWKNINSINSSKFIFVLFATVAFASIFYPAYADEKNTGMECNSHFVTTVGILMNAAGRGESTGLYDSGYGLLTGLSIIIDEGVEEDVFITAKEIFLIGSIEKILGHDMFRATFDYSKLFDDSNDIDWDDVLNEMTTASPDSKEKLEKTFDAYFNAEDLPKYSLLGAVLHQDDDKKLPFSITGELHREGPQCDIYNIPYRVVLKGGEVFEGTFDIPGEIAAFEIGLTTQPVSIEIDPEFEIFRYIPEEDRSEDEILNSSLTEKFSFIVVCDKGACFTQDIE